MRYIFFIAACMFFPSIAYSSDFYTDAGVTANDIDIKGTVYRPFTVRAKLGYILAPEYSIETHIATHVKKDEKDARQYQVRNLTGLFLRYGTPAKRKFRAYLAGGYTYVNLEITDASGNYFEDHHGFSYAIGLEENLKTFKDVSFTLEYARYLQDNSEDFTLSGVSLGFRAALF